MRRVEEIARKPARFTVVFEAKGKEIREVYTSRSIADRRCEYLNDHGYTAWIEV